MFWSVRWGRSPINLAEVLGGSGKHHGNMALHGGITWLAALASVPRLFTVIDARKSVPAIALMLILGQAHAFDVRGIHIGDRWDSDKLEQAMSYVSVPTARRVKCSNDGTESCVGTTRYLDADVRLIIEGENGRVAKVTITLPTDGFEDEIAALKREFGQPTNEWSSPPDATAPVLFSRRVDWRLPNEELFALKFSVMASIRLTRPQDSVANRYLPPS